MKSLEYKEISGGVKDIDVKKRIVTGYLSSFDNIDKHNDVIEKGAFKKTLLERKDDIFFLNNHSWQQPHGKFNVLQEDEKGLYFESTPFVEGVTYSEDVLKLYEAGVIKEHSIGFSTIKSENKSNSSTRYIKEVKLYEGSNVTLGANSQTPFTGMKGLNSIDTQDRIKVIMKAFRNGTFTDDTFILLEYALKELQSHAYDLGTKSLKENKSNPSLDADKSNNIITLLNNFTENI